MKSFSLLALSFGLAIPNAGAFPGLMDRLGSPTIDYPSSLVEEVKRAASPKPTFNAQQQYVSTTGEHAWQAPGILDERGPCPGLNAMANHGYIPRTGIVTGPQFILGTKQVFGMGADLSTILAAYGGAFDGVGAAWSIGGIEHTGIGGSHNNYETDSSPLRADLHQYGSNTKLIMEQFYELYNLQPNPKTANYDLEVMRTFRGIRFNESIAKNPDFYYGPFTGVVVSQAAFAFIYRFMGNKSEEHPQGVLDKEVLKSFMSISGPENDLKWTPGYERIPDNWYKRPLNDPYTIALLSNDINYISKGQPQIAVPGCNTGKTNSYHEINVDAMTGGAYNRSAVISNPLCFDLAVALAKASNLPTGPAVYVLLEALIPVQNALGCQNIPSLNSTVSKSCPGYSLYGGPTGYVAKGAIQN